MRGRIGIPFDHLLIYGTGGLAFADVSMNQTVTVGTNRQLAGSTDKTKAGWTLGGGAEYALCDNITLKGEALWLDLGRARTASTSGTDGGRTDSGGLSADHRHCARASTGGTDCSRTDSRGLRAERRHGVADHRQQENFQARPLYEQIDIALAEIRVASNPMRRLLEQRSAIRPGAQ